MWALILIIYSVVVQERSKWMIILFRKVTSRQEKKEKNLIKQLM